MSGQNAMRVIDELQRACPRAEDRYHVLKAIAVFIDGMRAEYARIAVYLGLLGFIIGGTLGAVLARFS